MLTRVLRYLRSQVLGLVAIFIALGGTGYAAIAIPKHSVGQGALKNDAVGTKQLRKHSVTNAKLAKGSVRSAQLRKGSVQGSQLKDGAVTSSKLGAGSVGTSQLAAGSVGTGQLAPGSVGTGQLAAGSVGTGQLAPGSVGGNQLAAGSVGPAQFSGVAAYTADYAVVVQTGQAPGSSPTATTSGWSNGSGTVTFAANPGTNDCTAFADVPSGSGSGTDVPAYATLGPATSSSLSVFVSAPSETTEPVVVWVECVA